MIVITGEPQTTGSTPGSFYSARGSSLGWIRLVYFVLFPEEALRHATQTKTLDLKTADIGT